MSDLMTAILWTGGALVVDLLLILIPLKVLAAVTMPFSMKTFGIRKVRRWHSRTDTLANLMLWISVLFCIAAPWIPYAPVIYIVWLVFTWLCALARVVRLSAVKARWKKQTVIFLITLLFAVALLAGWGIYNHYALWIRSYLFANQLEDGSALNLMYYLQNMQPAAYLLQTLILIFPLVSLWGQFKYMRLENTFKASSIGMYVFKSLIAVTLLFGASVFGQRALEIIYQTPPEEAISAQQASLPLSRQELAQRMTQPEPEQPPVEEQPQPEPQPSSQPPAEEQPSPEDQPAVEEQPVPEEQPQEAPELYYDEYGNGYDAAGNLVAPAV